MIEKFSVLKRWKRDRKWKVCKQVRDQKVWKQVKDGAQWSYNKGISNSKAFAIPILTESGL